MNQIKYYPNGDILEEYLTNESNLIKITYYQNHRINEVIYLNNNKLHRDDNKPAYIKFNLDGLLLIKIYYKNGRCHRDNNEPAFLKYSYIEKRYHQIHNKPSRFVKESKYFINGNFGRTDNGPTHLIYYSKSHQIEYAKYKSSLYFTYSCFNNNLPMNIIVDNNLLHSPLITKPESGESNESDKSDKMYIPALIKYDKNGKLLLEIYYHKGKIHKYDGPAKIVYAPDGSILEELRFINDKLVITKHDHIKNWGKMFAKNLNLF